MMYRDGPRRVGPAGMADPRLRTLGRVSSAARSLRSQGFYAPTNNSGLRRDLS